MKREIFTGELPKGWRTLFCDLETYYVPNKNMRGPDGKVLEKYSLSGSTVEEYVRDPRFQVLCAIALWDDEEEAHVLKHNEIEGFLSKVDWSRTVFVAHNAAFDGFILTDHYGHRPARIIDTMSLARMLHPNLAGGYSLGALDESLLGGDGKPMYLEAFAGFDTAHYDANPEVYDSFLRYNAWDTFRLRDLYRKLVDTRRVDNVELSSIDGMIRATTDPVLALDRELVERYADEKDAELEANRHLSNDERFAEALRVFGIEPETKMGAKKELYAFAKSDFFMQDLLENGSEEVRALVEGRLMAKSTSERGKARRFANIAARGLLPPFIQPNGAHTGRDSGGGSINLQNVKRKSPLRQAVMAQPGHKLVTVDSSQIECRVLNFMAGEEWVMDVFRGDGKIYEAAGERLFGRPVSEEETPELRHYAKIVELGSGYGLGSFGLMRQMKQAGVDLDEERCEEMISAYRGSHPNVVELWRRLEWLLIRMMRARREWTGAFLGELSIHYGKDRLRLPSGRHLVYPNLRRGDSGHEFDKLVRRSMVAKKTYGGSMAENVVQAMARDLIIEADCRVRRKWARHGVRLALRIHDELVYHSPAAIADDVYASVVEEMNRVPGWFPDIVLAAKGAVSDRWEKS